MKENDCVFVVLWMGLFDVLCWVVIMLFDKIWGVCIGVEKGKLCIESDNFDLGVVCEEIDVFYKGLVV